MPSLVQGIVGSLLSKISDKDLEVMIEDCDFQKKMKLYGDEKIDKPGWIKWQERLETEKEMRSKAPKFDRWDDAELMAKMASKICRITDQEGCSHEVVHTDDISEVMDWVGLWI